MSDTDSDPADPRVPPHQALRTALAAARSGVPDESVVQAFDEVFGSLPPARRSVAIRQVDGTGSRDHPTVARLLTSFELQLWDVPYRSAQRVAQAYGVPTAALLPRSLTELRATADLELLLDLEQRARPEQATVAAAAVHSANGPFGPDVPLDQRLERARLARGLLQEELSDRAGLSSTVSRRARYHHIRNGGHPSAPEVVNLGRALGIDPVRLVPENLAQLRGDIRLALVLEAQDALRARNDHAGAGRLVQTQLAGMTRGERLTRVMAARGLTPHELAARTDRRDGSGIRVDAAQLSHEKRGDRLIHAPELVAAADGLGVDPLLLLGTTSDDALLRAQIPVVNALGAARRRAATGHPLQAAALLDSAFSTTHAIGDRVRLLLYVTGTSSDAFNRIALGASTHIEQGRRPTELGWVRECARILGVPALALLPEQPELTGVSVEEVSAQRSLRSLLVREAELVERDAPLRVTDDRAAPDVADASAAPRIIRMHRRSSRPRATRRVEIDPMAQPGELLLLHREANGLTGSTLAAALADAGLPPALRTPASIREMEAGRVPLAYAEGVATAYGFAEPGLLAQRVEVQLCSALVGIAGEPAETQPQYIAQRVEPLLAGLATRDRVTALAEASSVGLDEVHRLVDPERLERGHFGRGGVGALADLLSLPPQLVSGARPTRGPVQPRSRGNVAAVGLNA